MALTYEELIEWLEYKQNLGFLWKKKAPTSQIKIGQKAGYLNPMGYRIIKINGQPYLEHRLVWLYYYKEFPSYSLDHIDGNKSNNEIENLREASASQNGANQGPHYNNKLGIKGIRIKRNKFCAQIQVNGKTIHLGTFDTCEAAQQKYNEAALLAFGEYARI